MRWCTRLARYIYVYVGCGVENIMRVPMFNATQREQRPFTARRRIVTYHERLGAIIMLLAGTCKESRLREGYCWHNIYMEIIACGGTMPPGGLVVHVCAAHRSAATRAIIISSNMNHLCVLRFSRRIYCQTYVAAIKKSMVIQLG